MVKEYSFLWKDAVVYWDATDVLLFAYIDVAPVKSEAEDKELKKVRKYLEDQKINGEDIGISKNSFSYPTEFTVFQRSSWNSLVNT